MRGTKTFVSLIFATRARVYARVMRKAENRGKKNMSSNKKLLILSDGVMGQVAKDIAESMGCFVQVDILDANYGNKDYDATYHAEAIGNISEYELFA